MRSRSAMTRGRSGPISMARLFLPPALMKALLARSTSAATSAGSGANRQRARLDAGHVQQVGHQVVHVVGLLLDDPEELTDHRGVKVGGRTQHRCCGTLDRGQRRP